MFGGRVFKGHISGRHWKIGLAASLLIGAVACGAQEESHDTTDPAGRRARYDAMATREPAIADWLSLRVAALTPDSTARAARYARMTIPAARDRVPWVEAQARERFGDTRGAIAAYTTLGARVNILRLRSASARTPTDSAVIRQEIVAYISAATVGAAVRDGYMLFDKFVATPAGAEQLAIARAAANTGQWGRARTGYAAAIGSGTTTPADRFAYATALAQGNDDSKAAQQYARVHGSPSLNAAAAYQRARALLALGKRADARTALRTLSTTFPKDTSAAAALSLLADLATDDLDDATARTLLLSVVRRFPTTRFATAARFNAAILAFVLGNDKAVVVELTPLAASPVEVSAQYWLGRAQQRQGDSGAAIVVWRRLLANDSTSYYAVLAARQLHTRNLNDLPTGMPYPHVAAVDSAFHRIALLRTFGMDPEIRFESDRLYSDAPSTQDRLLATASAFAGTDQSSRAIALGRRALVDYGANPAVFRLLYPVTARDTIVAQSRANDIDPILVTALIRQESNFNPRATSVAGASGLMQLMPSVAKSIAAGKGITPWSASRLSDPGINIMLGVAHLAPLLHRQPDLPRALAAYNAGESRVTRWARKRGADDPELFTERIPFTETRDYVKSIIRNREMYRALYSWP